MPQLINEMEAYASSLRKVNQDLGLRWLNTFIQTADILVNANYTNIQLAGKYYNEDIDKKLQEETFDYTGLCVHAVSKSLLCFLFKRYDEVIELAENGFKIIDNVLAWPHVVFLQALYAISLVHVAEKKPGSCKICYYTKQQEH